MSVEYHAGSELPSTAITWTDDTGAVIDFSTGWTFTLRLGIPPAAAELEKTTGITGAATAPNLTVAWAAGELDDITPGTRVMQITPRKDGKDRTPLTELFTVPASVAPVT